MAPLLLYIGKVAILLAVFYLFYRLLMERETFHRFNRVMMIGMNSQLLLYTQEELKMLK